MVEIEFSDIRYCTNRQLAKLLKCREADATLLSQGQRTLSDQMTSCALSRGIPLQCLIKGIRLRQKDARKNSLHQSRVNEFLQSVGQK